MGKGNKNSAERVENWGEVEQVEYENPNDDRSYSKSKKKKVSGSISKSVKGDQNRQQRETLLPEHESS